jgi:hypothetical protein
MTDYYKVESPTAETEDEPENPKIYNLLRGSRPRRRLRIVREDGSYFSIGYDDIQTLEGTADGRLLTLIIRGGLLVTLSGEMLSALADRLDEEKVIKLYCYREEQHAMRDASSPIITAIREEVPQG